MKKLALLCLPLAALSAPVSAATYIFTVSGGITGSGSLTTQDTPTVDGGYLVTAISGTYNGQVITGLLAPGLYPTSEPNDNLLFTDGSIFDLNGISFIAGEPQNIYGLGAEGVGLPAAFIDFNSGEFVNVSIAAVPEPATWSLMLLGFGAIGYSVRRRQRVTAVPRFA